VFMQFSADKHGCDAMSIGFRGGLLEFQYLLRLIY